MPADFTADPTKSVYVALTPEEVAEADDHAARMREVSRGMREAHGAELVNGDLIQRDGCRAEQAAAKALGVPWPKRINAFHELPDLDPDIEVKWQGVNWYGLRVRDADPTDRRYLAVFPAGILYRVGGWIHGADAKQDQYLIAGDPARPPMYAVPQAELRDVMELIV